MDTDTQAPIADTLPPLAEELAVGGARACCSASRSSAPA